MGPKLAGEHIMMRLKQAGEHNKIYLKLQENILSCVWLQENILSQGYSSTR
jgi:hypothetical protein